MSTETKPVRTTLRTPMFGYRPALRRPVTLLAYAEVSIDVIDRPQVTVSVWDSPWPGGDAQYDQRSFDGEVLFHLTVDSSVGPLVIDEWLRVGERAVEHLGSFSAPAMDPTWVEDHAPDDRLELVWHHIAAAMHASGRLVAYDEVDADQRVQLDKAEHLETLLEPGRYDAVDLAMFFAG